MTGLTELFACRLQDAVVLSLLWHILTTTPQSTCTRTLPDAMLQQAVHVISCGNYVISQWNLLISVTNRQIMS